MGRLCILSLWSINNLSRDLPLEISLSLLFPGRMNTCLSGSVSHMGFSLSMVVAEFSKALGTQVSGSMFLERSNLVETQTPLSVSHNRIPWVLPHNMPATLFFCFVLTQGLTS